MTRTFTSTIEIDDNSDIDQAKAWLCSGLDALAREEGYALTQDQIVLGTTFGVVEKEGRPQRLQGTLTTP